MMPFSGQRRLKWRIWPCILVLGVATAALMLNSQMIEVGDRGMFILVADGEIISHEFIHSMFDVRVIERFRIENGWLHLFHVDSESDAALEYYGIENRHENNVNQRIREFRIPIESIGSHKLHVRNQTVSLGVLQSSERCILIRLSSRPAVVNLAYSLWR
jgi:hypothetical protein